MRDYLKKMAQSLADWTIPPKIQTGIRSIKNQWKNQLSTEEKLLVSKNSELRDRHRGERCFILATGPSIKQQDLKLLKGENCIAVSNFFVHPDYHLIQPQYYCIAPYHLPITEEAWLAWMEDIEKNTGNTVIFFNVKDYLRTQSITKLKYYLNFTGSFAKVSKKGLDLVSPIPAPQSVTIMALLIAIYMGFKQIYLLGCDHDWILHINESQHFYEEKQHSLNQKGYTEWFGSDFASYCQDYIQLWQSYKYVRSLAQKNNIEIYNATRGGLLDVFTKINYESIFQKKFTEIKK